jgi:hypothetical protein
LSGQLAELRVFVRQETAKAETALRSSVEALGRIPKPQEVAAALTAGDPPPIFAAVADRLSNNSRFRESVRVAQGSQGASPDVRLVAAAFANCCSKQIAEALWRELREEIPQNEGLIASVAQSVHLTYGKDLKGRDGQDGKSPSVIEIAQQLGTDLDFAQLVADLKSK